jgi:hypothetical protein
MRQGIAVQLEQGMNRMKESWELLTEVAKDMPGGLPVFYAVLFVGLCAAFTFILEVALAIYRTRD